MCVCWKRYLNSSSTRKSSQRRNLYCLTEEFREGTCIVSPRSSEKEPVLSYRGVQRRNLYCLTEEFRDEHNAHVVLLHMFGSAETLVKQSLQILTIAQCTLPPQPLPFVLFFWEQDYFKTTLLNSRNMRNTWKICIVLLREP